MIGYYLLMNPREVDLRRVDLNLLVAFDALMSERSVTRAARQLNIGQSAMSSTLARLRKLLDDPVLVRSGRELVATPFAGGVARGGGGGVAPCIFFLPRGVPPPPPPPPRPSPAPPPPPPLFFFF